MKSNRHHSAEQNRLSFQVAVDSVKISSQVCKWYSDLLIVTHLVKSIDNILHITMGMVCNAHFDV